VSGREKPLFAANWKMFKGPAQTTAFVEQFQRLYPRHEDRRVVFFPPAISVQAFLAAASGRDDLEVGVQDVHGEVEGAHTGAISALMAAEAGVSWSLAGHSERRREFGDADEDVARKVKRILDASLRPLVCVGETLEEREAGHLSEVLERQVAAVLGAVGENVGPWLTWAYEPVWAIGTGRTAAPEDASEAHAVVRDAIARAIGAEAARQATIVYGGSVKPANIRSLMEAAGVDGVLVGGASLEPASFAEICSCPLDGTDEGPDRARHAPVDAR
jgi:triosephosphate isomerase